MSKIKLLPCPFCGGVNIDASGWARNDGVTGPACDDCSACADSVAEWNRRPIEAALISALHEAKATIHQLYFMRGCEAEGEYSEWVSDIDDAIAKAEGR